MRPQLLLLSTIALAALLGACTESAEEPFDAASAADLFEDAVASAALADGEGVDLGASLASIDVGAAADEDVGFAPLKGRGYSPDCRLAAFRERVAGVYDANGDGEFDSDELAELRADFDPRPERRRWEARFHRVQRLHWIYDADASGSLDAEERDALELGLEQRCMHREAWLLHAFDGDENGELDDDEWNAARADFVEHLAERAKAFLDRYDENGDGELDADERAEVALDRLEEILALHAEMVLSYDEDGNGRLDAGEREALREKLAAHVRSDALLDRIEPDPDPDPDPDDDDDDEPCRPVWHPRCLGL